MNIISSESWRKDFDFVGDFIPIYSTVNNIVDLFQKAYYSFDSTPSNSESYRNYIENKKITHIVLLSIPIINVITAIAIHIFRDNPKISNDNQNTSAYSGKLKPEETKNKELEEKRNQLLLRWKNKTIQEILNEEGDLFFESITPTFGKVPLLKGEDFQGSIVKDLSELTAREIFNLDRRLFTSNLLSGKTTIGNDTLSQILEKEIQKYDDIKTLLDNYPNIIMLTSDEIPPHVHELAINYLLSRGDTLFQDMITNSDKIANFIKERFLCNSQTAELLGQCKTYAQTLFEEHIEIIQEINSKYQKKTSKETSLYNQTKENYEVWLKTTENQGEKEALTKELEEVKLNYESKSKKSEEEYKTEFEKAETDYQGKLKKLATTFYESIKMADHP